MSKIYLSGLDWIIHALNSASQRYSPVGNCAQIILKLNGRVDIQQFKKKLLQFVSVCPAFNGYVSRAWTLEPYWKIRKKNKPPSVRIKTYYFISSDPTSFLENCVNSPFSHAFEYAVFHIINCCNNCSYLAMQFDHRLFDARGADMFLALFNQYYNREISIEEAVRACHIHRASLLNRWKERFLSGKHILRLLRDFSGCDIASLVDKGEVGGASSFITICLNSEESATFIAEAERKVGFMMFMPYALSMAVRAFDRICNSNHRNYIIPCTVDLRGTDKSLKTIFLNYCSMFFFCIDREQLTDHEQLIASVKDQFYNQSKQKVPQHFESVMALTRILPVSIFDKIICRYMRYCFGSFSFASTGHSLLDNETFCGIDIENIYHMPQIPPQVGVGFIFSQFNDRVNICISFRKGLISESDRSKIIAAFIG